MSSSPSFFNNDANKTLNAAEYKRYQQLQQELDGKMQELHRVPGSIYDIQQEQFHNTIMVGVLWSMLATATLYYVFKNV